MNEEQARKIIYKLQPIQAELKNNLAGSGLDESVQHDLRAQLMANRLGADGLRAANNALYCTNQEVRGRLIYKE